MNLNERYLDSLNDRDALDLLDTILHEYLHFSRPPEWQVRGAPYYYDHPYIEREAGERVDVLRDSFLKQRKGLGCSPY